MMDWDKFKEQTAVLNTCWTKEERRSLLLKAAEDSWEKEVVAKRMTLTTRNQDGRLVNPFCLQGLAGDALKKNLYIKAYYDYLDYVTLGGLYQPIRVFDDHLANLQNIAFNWKTANYEKILKEGRRICREYLRNYLMALSGEEKEIDFLVAKMETVSFNGTSSRGSGGLEFEKKSI